jgi:non-heme chloroperoxidase
VPTLIIHGHEGKIVPYADSAPLSAKLLKNGIPKTYQGFPHGMPTTHADTINADLLAFIKSRLSPTPACDGYGINNCWYQLK